MAFRASAPGIFFASAVIITPLLGVGVSASKLTSPWVLMGAFLLLFGLLLQLVSDRAIHPLPECMTQIGQNAILVSLCPLLAHFCPQSGLGISLGFLGGLSAIFGEIGSLPLALEQSEMSSLSWSLLGVALVMIFVLASIQIYLLSRKKSKKREVSEGTSLLPMK